MSSTVQTRDAYSIDPSPHNCGDRTVYANVDLRGSPAWLRIGSLRFDHGAEIVAKANAAERMRNAIRALAQAIETGCFDTELAEAVAASEIKGWM